MHGGPWDADERGDWDGVDKADGFSEMQRWR